MNALDYSKTVIEADGYVAAGRTELLELAQAYTTLHDMIEALALDLGLAVPSSDAPDLDYALGYANACLNAAGELKIALNEVE
jgi:hypothetical protein